MMIIKTIMGSIALISGFIISNICKKEMKDYKRYISATFSILLLVLAFLSIQNFDTTASIIMITTGSIIGYLLYKSKLDLLSISYLGMSRPEVLLLPLSIILFTLYPQERKINKKGLIEAIGIILAGSSIYFLSPLLNDFFIGISIPIAIQKLRNS